MSRAASLATLLFGVAVLDGCAYGMHESARTVAPGRFSGASAVSIVTNENTRVRGFGISNFGVDLGMLRVGVARHVDVGVGFLYFLGGRAEVKVSPFLETSRFALAFRAGGGGAANPTVVLAYLGAIASYDIGSWLTPYLGCTFANHWIYGVYRDPPPSGESLALRAGYGDGLLQSAAGFRFFVDSDARTPMSVSLEYGLWVPLQDDPGDGFSFVLTHIGSIGFCVGCPARAAPVL